MPYSRFTCELEQRYPPPRDMVGTNEVTYANTLRKPACTYFVTPEAEQVLTTHMKKKKKSKIKERKKEHLPWALASKRVHLNEFIPISIA